ncbi:MAG: InlB B-repeat-containing protein, partial [Bacilli bacterium]|nr:InlB B-repeat-containing protein [Bacilli bacterium]
YATNQTGSFVKTVVANGTGWYDAPDGQRYYPIKPIKIGLKNSGNYYIAYKQYGWSKYYGGSDKWWDLIFASNTNTSKDANSGTEVYEICNVGEHNYTLISESGKYMVLDGIATASGTTSTSVLGAADMTLSGEDIYYAAIDGTTLLFYQDGTFIDDKVATTGVLSSHNKCATVIANDKQYIVYTGSDTDNSLVITAITDDEVDEFLVPNAKNYQVTIDPNNGDTTIPMSVEDGTEITLPSASSLTVPVGTAFAGWKIGDDIYDAGDTFVVESDITIEAQWYEIIETANCTITKPVAGANPDMTPVSADSDKYKVSLRYVYLYENTYPHLSGDDEYESGKTYSYRIRFTSEEGYIFTEDTTFTVNGDATSSYGRLDERELQYAVPITYIVTVDPNNGEDTQEISGLEIGTNNCQISSPTSYGFTIPNGYEFAGWKIGDVIYNAGETFDVTGNMTAVAQWNPIEYQITYNLGEGIVSGVNPTTYTIESDNITLINPSKNDYYFAGWTGTGLSEPTQAVTIPQGSTGDREYTAQWIETTKITTITLDGEYVAPVVGETIP